MLTSSDLLAPSKSRLVSRKAGVSGTGRRARDLVSGGFPNPDGLKLKVTVLLSYLDREEKT